MKPCERKLHTWFFNPPEEPDDAPMSRPSTVGVGGLEVDDFEDVDDDAATLMAGDSQFFDNEGGGREDSFMTVTAGSQKSRGSSSSSSSSKNGRPMSKATLNQFTSAITEFLDVKNRSTGVYNELLDQDQVRAAVLLFAIGLLARNKEKHLLTFSSSSLFSSLFFSSLSFSLQYNETGVETRPPTVQFADTVQSFDVTGGGSSGSIDSSQAADLRTGKRYNSRNRPQTQTHNYSAVFTRDLKMMMHYELRLGCCKRHQATIVMAAVQMDDFPLLHYLVRHCKESDDIDLENVYGETALVLAAKLGRYNFLELILQRFVCLYLPS
jgi:hypothetical protein